MKQVILLFFDPLMKIHKDISDQSVNWLLQYSNDGHF